MPCSMYTCTCTSPASTTQCWSSLLSCKVRALPAGWTTSMATRDPGTGLAVLGRRPCISRYTIAPQMHNSAELRQTGSPAGHAQVPSLQTPPRRAGPLHAHVLQCSQLFRSRHTYTLRLRRSAASRCSNLQPCGGRWCEGAGWRFYNHMRPYLQIACHLETRSAVTQLARADRNRGSMHTRAHVRRRRTPRSGSCFHQGHKNPDVCDAVKGRLGPANWRSGPAAADACRDRSIDKNSY